MKCIKNGSGNLFRPYQLAVSAVNKGGLFMVLGLSVLNIGSNNAASLCSSTTLKGDFVRAGKRVSNTSCAKCKALENNQPFRGIENESNY